MAYQSPQGLASLGRNGDSMLVHMSPSEVAGLQGLAMAQGGSLTINPQTGLPEAFKLGGFFKSLLPTIVGVMTGGAGMPLYAGIAAGAATGALTNKNNRLLGAITGGLGGYSGFGIGNALKAAGTAVPKAVVGSATANAPYQGGWVNPLALCSSLIKHSNIKTITYQKIKSIEQSVDQWILKTEDQRIFNSSHVAICNAGSLNQFDLTQHLHLDLFRGQVNWINSKSLQMPRIVVCDEGYLIPMNKDKHFFGATYAMNDFDKNVRTRDTKKNIASIMRIHHDFYNHCLSQQSISGRVSWRASSKDRKPFVGRISDNQLLKKMRVEELS